jgi:ribonuclease BN (tRNA processing enzyme)
VHALNEVETIWLLPDEPRPVVLVEAREGAIENGNAVRIDVMRSYAHPREGAYLYKVSFLGRSVVYASDTEGYEGGDRRLIQFARETNLLIHDAQYTYEEYISSTVPEQG